MKRGATSQTRNAIDRLRAAGFDRKDFRVRTLKDKYGCYGMPVISIWSTSDEIYNRREQLLANGFSLDVYRWTTEGVEKLLVLVADRYTSTGLGKLTIYTD